MLSSRPLALALVASVGVLAGMSATPATAQLYNPCPYTNDGDCDEPNGLNLCAWGTDTADCSNPNANYGQGSGYRPGSSVAGANPAPGAATSGATPTPTAGAPTSYSPWRRITNDQRQYATQPGGVMPLLVYNDVRFQAGNYIVYHGITDGSGPTAPIWNIQQVPVTLTGGTRYVARASSGGFESFQSAGGSLIMYPDPGPRHAMIYARNDDIQNWRAICVLPVGMPMAMCGP